MVSDQTPDVGPDDQAIESLSVQEVTDRAVARFLERYAETIETAPHLSVDVLFELLAHPGRRYVLTYLLRTDGAVTCSDLVEYVLSRTDSSSRDGRLRDDLAGELTHTHLPRLDRADLVDYDVERQIVRPSDLTPLTAPYLEFGLAQERCRCRALSGEPESTAER